MGQVSLDRPGSSSTQIARFESPVLFIIIYPLSSTKNVLPRMNTQINFRPVACVIEGIGNTILMLSPLNNSITKSTGQNILIATGVVGRLFYSVQLHHTMSCRTPDKSTGVQMLTPVGCLSVYSTQVHGSPMHPVRICGVCHNEPPFQYCRQVSG